MPLIALLTLFIVVPFVELYFILQAAQVIGAPATVLILIGASVLGSLLLRAQGRSAWRRFNQALQERRMPHNEVLDGILIVFGGAFLITPGYVTDVVGLLLLLPPSRAVARRLLVRALGRRVLVGVVGGRAAPPPRSRPGDVNGAAWEEPPSDGHGTVREDRPADGGEGPPPRLTR